MIGTDSSLALIDSAEGGASAEICDILPRHIIVCEEHSIAAVRAEKGHRLTLLLVLKPYPKVGISLSLRNWRDTFLKVFFC